MNIERRDVQGLELREEVGQPAKIQGYAATFNSVYDVGEFREVVLPGAFTETLSDNDDVVALLNHDPSSILGRRDAKTLRLKEDDKGLKVTITPPDTATGRDVVENLRNGNLRSMSIGFITRSDNWRTEDDRQLRELRSVALRDVSVVAFPANPDTSVALRSMPRLSDTQWLEQQRLRLDLEAFDS